MEITDNSIKGIYHDILKGADDNIIYYSGWRSNTIVHRCRMLFAGFMKNDASSGIQFLAVGQGLKEWDGTGAPEPAPATTTDLFNGYSPPIPVSDLDLVYLDENDAVVIGPTNRLQITATLEPGYPAPILPLTTYPLREFGLFGSLGGTDNMINNIRHPVIHKDSSSTLIRVVRLYF